MTFSPGFPLCWLLHIHRSAERWRRSEPINSDGKLPRRLLQFKAGLFQETLPKFGKRTDLTGRLVVQFDSRPLLRNAVRVARLAPHLKTGDILFFDEFTCPLDEFHAFQELTRCFHMKYSVLGVRLAALARAVGPFGASQATQFLPEVAARWNGDGCRIRWSNLTGRSRRLGRGC